MNNKVALIVPYFGTLPNYFSLWLKSATYNNEFSFLIYTDSIDKSLYTRYDNIILHRMSFSEFANKIRKLFDFPISLESPYKLCDYKPTYGAALAEDLREFEFWGYCDIDLIFGCLRNYLTDDILNNYDRIYNLGHFTLYRNNAKMNNLYKISHDFRDCFSYKYSYQTPFVTAYDEIGTKYGYGLSTICQRQGIKNYKSLDFADVLPDKFRFELAYTNNEVIDYFVYERGRLYGICEKTKKEFAYVHLQKRSMQCDKLDENIYYISPTHFRNNEQEAMSDIKSIRDEKSFYRNVLDRRFKSKIKKLKQGALIHLLNKKIGKINRS